MERKDDSVIAIPCLISRLEKRPEFSETNRLPPGWEWATIPQLISSDGMFVDGDWVESKDQDPNGGVRLVQLADVGDGFYRNKSSRYLTLSKAEELNCTFLKENDLLVARMPEPLGRSCLFPGDPKPCVTAVDVCIVRTGSGGADRRWLMYQVNSIPVRNAIAALQTGTTRQRISRSNLAKIRIPVPPLPEQHRIVEKLKKLLERIGRAKASIEKVPKIIKQFRQTVLAAACSGRLVEQDPSEEPASELLKRIRAERKKKWEQDLIAKGKDPKKYKYEEPPEPHTSGLPELPSGWAWTTLDLCSTLITKGESPNWQGFKYVQDGVLFIRSENVLDGRLDLTKQVKITLKFHKKLSRSQLQPFDVLFTLVGASIGRCTVLPPKFEEANINQAVALVRLSTAVSSGFLMYVLISPKYKDIILGKRVEVARPNISLRDLKELAIPLPPFAEQHRIVAKVEELFTLADTIEASVTKAQVRAEKIKQSLLSKAFRGELVEQDPNDPPASVLLEQIKLEKEKMKAGSKARGKRTAASARR